jgi:hypothetical protein
VASAEQNALANASAGGVADTELGCQTTNGIDDDAGIMPAPEAVSTGRRGHPHPAQPPEVRRQGGAE